MLFKISHDIIKYMPFSYSLDFNAIKPSIEVAQPHYLKGVLGSPLYHALDAAFNTTPVEAKMAKLVPYAQRPVAFFSYLMFMPVSTVHITENGVHIITNNDRKTPFPWQVNEVKDHLEIMGMISMDHLLDFLDENKIDYPQWTSSDAYKALKGNIITSAAVFNEYVRINSSRRLFLLLQPHMKDVERNIIVPAISQELYDEIMEQLVYTEVDDSASGSASGQTLSAHNEKLLPYLQRVIAHHTMVEAGTSMMSEIMEYGYAIRTFSTNGNNSIILRESADSDKVSARVRQHERKAVSAMGELQKFLYKNAANYASYKASSSYRDPTEPREYNTKERGIFFG